MSDLLRLAFWALVISLQNFVFGYGLNLIPYLWDFTPWIYGFGRDERRWKNRILNLSRKFSFILTVYLTYILCSPSNNLKNSKHLSQPFIVAPSAAFGAIVSLLMIKVGK